jgi:hypothetical protein
MEDVGTVKEVPSLFARPLEGRVYVGIVLVPGFGACRQVVVRHTYPRDIGPVVFVVGVYLFA